MLPFSIYFVNLLYNENFNIFDAFKDSIICNKFYIQRYIFLSKLIQQNLFKNLKNLELKSSLIIPQQEFD